MSLNFQKTSVASNGFSRDQDSYIAERGVFGVFDGCGDRGQYASSIAEETFRRMSRSQCNKDRSEFLREAFEEANTGVCSTGENTTAAVVWYPGKGDFFYYGSIGDSPIYIIDKHNKILWLVGDEHSKDDKRYGLGRQDSPKNVRSGSVQISGLDSIVLMTDGCIPSGDYNAFKQTLKETLSEDWSARAIVERARKDGSYDDATCVLVGERPRKSVLQKVFSLFF